MEKMHHSSTSYLPNQLAEVATQFSHNIVSWLDFGTDTATVLPCRDDGHSGYADMQLEPHPTCSHPT